MLKKFISFALAMLLSLSLLSISAFASPYLVWQEETVFPETGQLRNSFIVDNKMYVIHSNVGATSELAEMYIYDTEAKTWQQGAAMNTPRYNVSGAVIGQKIYIVGGIPATGNTNNAYNTLEIYDIATDTWSYGKDAPVATSSAGVVAYNGKLYVFGGAANGLGLNNVQIYDPLLDSWSAGSAMPDTRLAMGAAVYGDKAYVVGGRKPNPGNIGASETFIYDFASDQWVIGTQSAATDIIPQPVSFPAVGVFEDNIYVIGGYKTSQSDAVDSVQVYNIPSQTWSLAQESLPIPLSGLSCAISDEGRIYVLGGATNGISNHTVYSTSLHERLFVLLNIGEQVQLSVHYNLSENLSFNWTSADPSIASVQGDGMVTAHSEGETFIRCSSPDGTFADYIPVKVYDGTADDYRLAVHLQPNEQQLLWIVNPATAVHWVTMDSSVADVDLRGEVTGISHGLCIVKGIYNAKEYHIYVRVS